MKLYESKIIDIECMDHIRIQEAKELTYRGGLEIYAVKRSIYTSNTERAFLHSSNINTAWWCGYVEVPLDMYGLLKPKGYLDEEILCDELDDPDKYGIACVHGGYTYIGYGIPRVLDGDQRIFLGWDYNHWLDTENCVTYQEILEEGMKVIDSMLDPKSTG